MSIDGSTFVITGGARGIGAATAVLASERGANVVVSDVLVNEGREIVDLITSAGGSAHFVETDLADDSAVHSLMAEAVGRFGGIDVLHNNAGVHEAMLSDDHRFEDLSVETFDRVLAINLRAPFVCAKAAFPYLAKSQRAPSIINAGSTASFAAYPAGLAYGTSKGGIAQLTRNLALALAPYGIRANCYCPATVDTPMVDRVSQATSTDDASRRSRQVSTHLVNRIGEPSEIAELVCYLAGEEAAFVNGAVWLIDGGTLAWRGTLDQLDLG